MAATILAVCAHADDEAFGIAGTLARHVDEGDEVHVVFMCDGVSSRDVGDDIKRLVDERRRMARSAAKAMGCSPPRFFDFPDNRLDTIALLDVVKIVEAVVGELRPNVVYTNHVNDLNVDHRITHQAVLTACRPMPGSNLSSIYSFETLSSTEWEPTGLGRTFHPTRYVDISKYLQQKLSAVMCYGAELRASPHPRSPEVVRSLCQIRGSEAGFDAAEALVVVRERY